MTYSKAICGVDPSPRGEIQGAVNQFEDAEE